MENKNVDVVTVMKNDTARMLRKLRASLCNKKNSYHKSVARSADMGWSILGGVVAASAVYNVPELTGLAEHLPAAVANVKGYMVENTLMLIGYGSVTLVGMSKILECMNKLASADRHWVAGNFNVEDKSGNVKNVSRQELLGELAVASQKFMGCSVIGNGGIKTKLDGLVLEDAVKLPFKTGYRTVDKNTEVESGVDLLKTMKSVVSDAIESQAKITSNQLDYLVRVEQGGGVESLGVFKKA